MTGRLTARDRCPTARYLANAYADDFTLEFSKVGEDGSGKATLVRSPGKRAHGAIFEIDHREREPLNEAEPGYRRDDGLKVTVSSTGGCEMVTTYIALDGYTNPELKPFDWYLALIVAGAMEHRFPSTVIAHYRATAARVDRERKRKLVADLLLREAGFTNTEQVLRPN